MEFLAVLAVLLTALSTPPCGHLQPLAGSILHRGGVDRGTQLCHDYLAGCLCPSQRAACGVRRQIHHGDRCLFHVGIPHRVELCAGAGFPFRRYGRLDCDVCGLGIPARSSFLSGTAAGGGSRKRLKNRLLGNSGFPHMLGPLPLLKTKIAAPGQIRPGAACVKGVSGTSLSMISCGLSAFTHLLAVRAYKRAHVPSCSYGVSFASTTQFSRCSV